MYKGIQRKQYLNYSYTMPTKTQIIQEEQIECNGIISTQYVVKTKDYSSDPNISYLDFEVNNLMAAGVDINNMQETKLSPNIEKLEANANTANQIIEQYLIIKQLENERQQENHKETTVQE